jgi:Fe-S-cluster-containing dehydrogenase component
MQSFIIELSLPDCVSVCRLNGSRIRPTSTLGQDLLDCVKSGDCEPACRYVLETYKPQIRIVKQVNGQYANVLASAEDMIGVCEAIYFESETDFNNTDNCALYLLWQAAADYQNEVLA